MLLLYDAVNAAFAALTYFSTSDEIILKLKVHAEAVSRSGTWSCFAATLFFQFVIYYCHCLISDNLLFLGNRNKGVNILYYIGQKQGFILEVSTRRFWTLGCKEHAAQETQNEFWVMDTA